MNIFQNTSSLRVDLEYLCLHYTAIRGDCKENPEKWAKKSFCEAECYIRYRFNLDKFKRCVIMWFGNKNQERMIPLIHMIRIPAEPARDMPENAAIFCGTDDSCMENEHFLGQSDLCMECFHRFITRMKNDAGTDQICVCDFFERLDEAVDVVPLLHALEALDRKVWIFVYGEETTERLRRAGVRYI